MMIDRSTLVAKGRQTIKKGSLSFAMAASFLGEKTRDSVYLLYRWCRATDDAIDKLAPTATTDDKLQVVANLRQELHATNTADEVSLGMQLTMQSHEIPAYYPEQLIAGMAMDCDKLRYQTLEELLQYCYRVAGVVGLMSSHIFGLRAAAALRHASHMGMAMQLTNIARDIFEDLAMGRIYIPQALLRSEDATNRVKVANAAKRLLAVADLLYISGDRGLKYLPTRVAVAVAVARCVYAEIGSKVIARGAHAWDERVYVPKWRKLTLMPKALWLVIKSKMPTRDESAPDLRTLPVYRCEDAVEDAADLIQRQNFRDQPMTFNSPAAK